MQMNQTGNSARPRLICADLHGETAALLRYVQTVREGRSAPGTVILAGDVYGGRGPSAVDIVRVMFDVKYGRLPVEALMRILEEYEIPTNDELRQQMPHFVSDTLHSGIFLTVLAKQIPGFAEWLRKDLCVAYDTMDDALRALIALGCDVWMIPGNGEQATCVDFVYDDDWMTEHVVAFERSFFAQHRMPAELHMVWDAAAVDGILLCGMDFDEETVSELCQSQSFDLAVTHYLPTFCTNREEFAAELCAELPFPHPLMTSAPDLERSRRAAELYRFVGSVLGGHYHTGDTIRDEHCPDYVLFGEEKLRRCWIKPGVLVEASLLLQKGSIDV